MGTETVGQNRGRASKYLRADDNFKSFRDTSALLAGRPSTDSRSGGKLAIAQATSVCICMRAYVCVCVCVLRTSAVTAGNGDHRARIYTW